MSEQLRRCLLALLGAWLMAPLLGAQGAELYGYVDGLGVAHFANEPVDSRYDPVLRGPDDDVGRVPGKTMVRSSLLTWMEFAPEVKALQGVLREAGRATGVDPELLQAMITVESGYRNDLVSPKGAIGLMQIMPVTGDRYATKAEAAAEPVEKRLRDPRQNVMAGARMLADLTRRFGAVDAAIAAWNAGEGRVRQAGGKVPQIAETQAHVHLVLELYWSLLQQRQHHLATTLSLVSQTFSTPKGVR